MKEIQDQIFIKAGDLPGDGDFFNLPGDLTALGRVVPGQLTDGQLTIDASIDRSIDRYLGQLTPSIDRASRELKNYSHLVN